MKHLKKSLLLCLLFSGFSFSTTMAGEAGVTFLFRNGTKASFTFEKKPCIAMTADGVCVSAEGESQTQFLFSDIQRYYFDDDIETGVKALQMKSVACPLFRYENGVVAVSGMSPGETLRALTASGKLVSSVKADADGNARIDLNSISHGILVITTPSGIGCKVVKK